MSTSIARKPLAERLKAGLHEGIQYAQGKIDLRTAEIPQSPPKFSSKSVVRLRQSAGMSQTVFARLLNVSSKTIQSWEQGQRQPSQAAQRMLQVFQEQPEMVYQVVGIVQAASGIQSKKAGGQKRATSVSKTAKNAYAK
jgi:putative transcriptional regulator